MEKPFIRTPKNPPSDADRALNTLGFALYDLIHIFCAIAFIIFALNEKNIVLDSGEVTADFAIELADEFTELIMSLLLIVFIIFIYHSKTQKTQMSYYTFAWMLVSLSLLIPATFEIAPLYVSHQGPTYSLGIFILRNINLYLPLVAFLSFVVALVIVSHGKLWHLFLNIGIFSMMLFACTSLSVYTIEQSEAGDLAFSFQTFLRYLFCLAPFAPGLLTLFSLHYFDPVKAAKEID